VLDKYDQENTAWHTTLADHETQPGIFLPFQGDFQKMQGHLTVNYRIGQFSTAIGWFNIVAFPTALYLVFFSLAFIRGLVYFGYLRHLFTPSAAGEKQAHSHKLAGIINMAKKTTDTAKPVSGTAKKMEPREGFPNVPTPDEGVLKTAVGSFRNVQLGRALRSFRKATEEASQVSRAVGELHEAELERLRKHEQLKDADTTLESDKLARDTELQEAETAKMDVDMTYLRKKEEYEKFKAGETTSEDPEEEASPAVKEALKELHFEEESAAVRAALEEKYTEEKEKLIKKCGSEDKLTPQDHDYLSRLRDKIEEIIRESFEP